MIVRILAAHAHAASIAAIMLTASIPAGAQCPDIVFSPTAAPTDGYFGSAISATSDGAKMVAGILYFDGPSGHDSGAAWVFELQGSTVVETMLLPSDGELLTYFGRSVAISDDGSFVAVGAPLDTTTVIYSGSVRIFVNDELGTWREQATLLANNPTYFSQFGEAIAISADGTRIVVGARFSQQHLGAAYVYHREADQWSFEAELKPVGMGEFGFSVAITAAGDGVIVGAHGAAAIYKRTDATWKLQRSFESPQNWFSVDISADGETALVGGMETAFVSRSDGQNWTDPVLLTSCAPMSAGFGSAVSLSANGDLAMVGAPGQLIGGMGTGAVHVYRRESGRWRQIALLPPRQIHGDVRMGICLDFASLTSQLFVGADRYFVDGAVRGAILQLHPGIGCFGDLDGNGAIDVNDLLTLINTWGPCGKVACPADIDLDGIVEVDDLRIMIDVWNCLTAN